MKTKKKASSLKTKSPMAEKMLKKKSIKRGIGSIKKESLKDKLRGSIGTSTISAKNTDMLGISLFDQIVDHEATNQAKKQSVIKKAVKKNEKPLKAIGTKNGFVVSFAKKYEPRDLVLKSYFLDDLEKLVGRFEYKNSCRVRYNIENLKIRKTSK